MDLENPGELNSGSYDEEEPKARSGYANVRCTTINLPNWRVRQLTKSAP